MDSLDSLELIPINALHGQPHKQKVLAARNRMRSSKPLNLTIL